MDEGVVVMYKGKKTKGVAMGYVIMIIALFTFLGTAMLVMATGNVRQATMPIRHAQYFYAAESAVHVVAQELWYITADEFGYELFTFPTMEAEVEDFADSLVFRMRTLGGDTPGSPSAPFTFSCGRSVFRHDLGGTMYSGERFIVIQLDHMPNAAIRPFLCSTDPMGWHVEYRPGGGPDDGLVLSFGAMGIGNISADGSTSGGVIVRAEILLATDPGSWRILSIR